MASINTTKLKKQFNQQPISKGRLLRNELNKYKLFKSNTNQQSNRNTTV